MTLSNRRLPLVAALVALNILLVVVGWMMLISPQQKDAAAAATKEQLAQTQLAALIGGSTSSPAPTKQPPIHTADLYTLDTALPAQADQPGLLLELSRLATASGVRILGISPQAAQANANGFTVVPINLSLEGTYFKLTGFLQTLRLLVSKQRGHLIAHGPLFAVTSATFAPGTGKKKDATATVGVEAFYYGVTAGATPPASTTGTDTTTTTGS
jgi:hypothetical protein